MNDPINWIDPDGLTVAAPVVVIGVPLLIGAACYALLPPEQKRAMAHDLQRLWNWLWKEGTEDNGCPEGEALDDYPADPDEWVPPEGWEETPADQQTGGRHRIWKGPEGKWRRWDREGRKHGKKRGPHWHDWRYPDRHIDPTR